MPIQLEQRWDKITRCNEAGYRVDLDDFVGRPASPAEYLERQGIANAHLGDDVQFMGVLIGPGPSDLRIWTSQPHVVGEKPEDEELDSWLESKGWTRKPEVDFGGYGASAWTRGTIWMFDVRPVNFVKKVFPPLMPDGLTRVEMVPIDVMAQRSRKRSPDSLRVPR